MKKNFDERLKGKIKSLFENHQEPYQEAHWELLKARLEAKKKRKIILWWQSAKVAAVLLPVCILAGWYFLNSEFRNSPKIVSQQKQIEYSPHVDSLRDDLKATPQMESRESPQVKNQANSTLIPPIIAPEWAKDYQKQKPSQNLEGQKDKVLEYSSLNLTPQETGRSIQPLATFQNPIISLDMNRFQERILKQMDHSLVAYFSLENVLIGKIVSVDGSSPSYGKSIQYGVGLTSMYNYTEVNSSSAFNYGGSVSADFPIYKRLSFSSGLMMSKQSFSLEEPSKAFTPSTNFTSIQDFGSTDIRLVALDIPMNLSYQFKLSQNKSLNLSAGLSSLVYFKENFSSSYTAAKVESIYDATTGNYNNVTQVAEIQQNDSPQALSRFDFARLLNVSVGFSYPLSPRMHLQVEPYLKYPLGSLTQKNLKFGMGGIQLRLKFGR